MAVLLPVCSLCEQTPTNGIRGGMRILSIWLCHHCLERLNDQGQDADLYQKLTTVLKKNMSSSRKWYLAQN